MTLQKLVKLIKWELKIQNKVNNIVKYLFAFCIFSVLIIALVSKQEDINKFGLLFSVIYIPLSFVGFTNFIFKQDMADGMLELLLSSFSSIEIVIAKTCSIFICAIISNLLSLPVIAVIFDLSVSLIFDLSLTMILTLILTSAVLVLISATQSYFRSNTNFLSILIMPLIIPNIILTGLVLQDYNNFYLIYVMIGVNLIIVPFTIILSSYLIKNIYNA